LNLPHKGMEGTSTGRLSGLYLYLRSSRVLLNLTTRRKKIQWIFCGPSLRILACRGRRLRFMGWFPIQYGISKIWRS
ncbi:hypothetical protein K443DRAFT_80931, partial [Laccaria amethystina LaAM-08-1]